MPKLLRLNGRDIQKILERNGFSVVRIKGSHHIMRREITLDDGNKQNQTVAIPVHGKKSIPIGTLRSIVRSLSAFLPEDMIQQEFYAD